MKRKENNNALAIEIKVRTPTEFASVTRKAMNSGNVWPYIHFAIIPNGVVES